MSKLILVNPGVSIGSDPEVFLSRPGRGKRPIIVGSETIIKKPIDAMAYGLSAGTIVTDGVQVELHPKVTGGCRQNASLYLGGCLRRLHEEAQRHGLQVDFRQVVNVSRAELEKLSDHAKFLGCTPSFNFYGRQMKCVNGLEYRKRSAAGHIHIGSKMIHNEKQPAGVIKAERLIPALELSCGIIGVLLDRDPGAIERRKLYGKAGEYRLPPHGLEYRTLSNFWLISYPVMSLMFGQAKNAMMLAYSELPIFEGRTDIAKDALNEMISKADLKKVEKAINKNDADLAFKIYDEAIKPVMLATKSHYGLGSTSEAGDRVYDAFEAFIKKPLGEWFPGDPVDNWNKENMQYGWESFAYYKINGARK
jgi:hypothetical protein